MEGLTKHQLILVALLLSFVTSIATGIVTVSLMDQAPKSVTNTINRVVEKTIEKVVPAQSQTASVVKETVVVNAEDLTIDSIAKNSKSLVRIKRFNTDTNSEDLISIGMVVSKEGSMIADLGLLSAQGRYTATDYSGISFDISLIDADPNTHIAYFLPVKNDNLKISFVPAVIGDANNLKIGQTVIALGGAQRNTVAIGNVSSLVEKVDSSDSKKTYISLIDTSVNLKDPVFGTFLLDLKGEIVGIQVNKEDINSRNTYLPVNLIKKNTSTSNTSVFQLSN